MVTFTKRKKGEIIMVTMAELYYFSPTGGTKKAAELFCAGVAEHTEQIDLCSRGQEPKQPESGLVVLAAPVYASTYFE